MRSAIFPAVFLVVLAADAASGEAQPAADAGCIRGRVMLDVGRTGRYANVVLKSLGQGRICDERGEFRFDGIAPGRYTLSAMLIGYRERAARRAISSATSSARRRRRHGRRH